MAVKDNWIINSAGVDFESFLAGHYLFEKNKYFGQQNSRQPLLIIMLFFQNNYKIICCALEIRQI
jgi:hypothetical protein